MHDLLACMHAHVCFIEQEAGPIIIKRRFNSGAWHSKLGRKKKKKKGKFKRLSHRQ